MIKHLKIIVVSGLLLTLFLSCSREQKREKGLFERRGKTTEPGYFEEREEEKDEAETIFKIESVDDIGRIEKITPETFVKITILYRKESKIWIDKSIGLPASEQERFIEEANAKFFFSLGITEEEYVSFSENNIDELNTYLEAHPELVPIIMEE